METFFESGIFFLRNLQSMGEWLVLPMRAVTFLGSEEFFLLVLPALYWCVDTALGFRVALILLVASSLNGALKLAFHAPRPYWISPEVKAFAAETSFGVPSGHAQIAAGVWGMIAATARRGWVWLVCGSLILLIGFSRMYLGVHFPHDVILGWLLGAITLGVMLWLWRPLSAHLALQSFGNRLLLALGVSFGMILIELIPYLWLRLNFTLPPSWLEHAAAAGAAERLPDPLTIEGAWSNAGAFFGLMLGFIWVGHCGRLDLSGKLGVRIARYVVGLIGVLLLWRGLSVLFGLLALNELLSFLLRYVRYALTGFWISAGAPFLFLRLRWMTIAPGESSKEAEALAG
ncbi:MAG: phosphatase PAP2 family protein [Anaerolineales bacterium]|nr:phosphatase PAP2 family protein [Anaerolineales bacterium]MCS7248683.1 phosphatase PAP2 family protein [Anaerolineales bacterium]MDW8162496.1 phosphatase PAP2 family protein [Anaerolineales bacterium]MDW8447467.1 phosphatase PAP2 family protein [Anaerolineales bacterium]